MNSLSEIANGAAFDVAEAIRTIAKHLTLPDMIPSQNDELERLLDPRLAEILRRAGLQTPQQVRAAPDAYLLTLDGVGVKTVARIRAWLGDSDGMTRPAAAEHHQLRFEQLQDEEAS